MSPEMHENIPGNRAGDAEVSMPERRIRVLRI